MRQHLTMGAGITLMLLFPVAAQEDEPLIIDFSSSTSVALHIPVGDQRVEVVPAFEDYAYMMYDICAAVGLDILNDGPCSIYPMNGSLGGNAIATVSDGNRLIVYDRELSPLIGYEGAEAVIAHEIAHHYCGHLQMLEGAQVELEADAFAGAAMRLLGRPLDSALSSTSLFSDRPSRSHPSRAERIEAITRGWNYPEYGTSCGNRKGT